MGGYCSTRWNGERNRLDTAGLLRLDVRHMRRTGVLQPGARSTWQWTRDDGEPAGTIVTIMDHDRPRLTLDYSTRRAGETDWTPRKVHVWLDTTPCHYGGERTWLRCPHCHTRRAVLFSVDGAFACRACHDLAYTSTREDEASACDRRIRAIADRLGSDGNGRRGFLWTMPDKPKGMHWRTYDHLTRELYREHERREDLFAERAMTILARVDCFLEARTQPAPACARP